MSGNAIKKMKLGELNIQKISEIIRLREKVILVAVRLRYSKMSATRLATRISEISRSFVNASVPFIFKVRINSNKYLSFEFEPGDLKEIEKLPVKCPEQGFFDQAFETEVNNKPVLVLKKRIEDESLIIDDDLIVSLTYILSRLTESELLAEIERKNVELVKAYEELELSKSELLERMQRIGKIGGWEINLHDMSTSWTEGVYEIHELPLNNETNLENGINYFAPDVRPKIQAAVEKGISDAEPWDMELPLVTNKGNKRWVRVIGFPETDGNKTIRLSGIIQDITEKKLAEKDKQEIFDRLTLITKSARMGVWDWNVNTRILDWDDTMFKLYGVQQNGKMDSFPIWEKRIHPKDREAFELELEKAIADEADFESESRVIWPDKSQHIIRSVAMVQRSKSNDDVRVVGLSWDITKEKEAERVRLRAEKLMAKNKELEQFAYIASHDLQEPLRTVANYTRVIEEDYGNLLGKDGLHHTKSMKAATSRMSDLIKGLLEHSRIGTNHRLTEVSCHKVIANLKNDLQLRLKEKNVKIKISKLPKIKAYETEFRLLIQNLISNAIKFSRPETSPKIEIGCIEKEDTWQFSIKDNGIGIAEKHKEKIFRIFQRLHHSSEYEGTGIGLAHCQKIVELHGGKIWVSSEPGQGSTFYFTIYKM